jgi:hypothetical protein
MHRHASPIEPEKNAARDAAATAHAERFASLVGAVLQRWGVESTHVSSNEEVVEAVSDELEVAFALGESGMGFAALTFTGGVAASDLHYWMKRSGPSGRIVKPVFALDELGRLVCWFMFPLDDSTEPQRLTELLEALVSQVRGEAPASI